MTHPEVIIVGADPTGLMLAAELRLAGVRPLVLERHPHVRDTPKAGGLDGQILELLRYRGLLERFQAACPGPAPAPRFPFGGVHLDFTRLAGRRVPVVPLHLQGPPGRPLPRPHRLDRARRRTRRSISAARSALHLVRPR
ncbi:FAD-dependent monooxygenase [Nonomuraea wenchangensis]